MKKILYSGFYFSYFGVALFVSSYAQVSSAHSSQESFIIPAADSGWAYVTGSVLGVPDWDSANKLWGSSSQKFLVWNELRARQYRDRGTAFFEKFPNDIHFRKWFEEATFNGVPPQYWKNPEKEAATMAIYLEKGTPNTPRFDEAAEAAWQAHYLVFRQRYLGDSSLTNEEKADFKGRELQADIGRFAYKLCLGTGDLGARFHGQMPLILHYCKAALDLAEGPEHNNRVIGQLLGDVAPHDPDLETALIDILKKSTNEDVRNQALQREDLLKRMREKPIELKVPYLEDKKKIIDLSALRGKVVALEFWNINCGGCIAHMAKYERIYKQFHKKGFEMVSVCVIGADAKDDGSKAREEAIRFHKKKAVTYLSGEFNPGLDAERGLDRDNPTWKFFDCVSGGSVFILDREGKLVNTEPTGQWMEYEIRKLLKLPLDETGK